MSRRSPKNASAADFSAALAFLGAIVAAFLLPLSRVAAVPVAVVVIAAAPRRSTRPIARWAAIGFVVGIIVAAIVVSLVAG